MTVSSDDDLRAAADRVADTLITHAAVMNPGWGGGPAGIRALVAEHATRCMTLDPQKIINEVDRVREVVKEVDPSRAGTVHDSLDEASGTLENWTGSAAESFRARVRDLGAFSSVQYERSLAYAKALAALASLAVQTRSDYHTVAEHTIAAANQARADAKEQGLTFAIKVCGAFAKAAFAGFKLDDIAGAAIDIAVEGTALHISGGSMEDIMASYQNAVHGVVMGLNEGISQVESDLHAATAGIDDTRDALVSPLPSTTRTTSPDFRYEAFATDSRPAAEFGPAVTEEKRRMQPAPARRSAISTRLAGGPE